MVIYILNDENIIKQTLLKLDNWVLDTDINDKELTDMDYNKSVTRDEILQVYDDVTQYAISYLQRNDLSSIPVIETALIFWTAGVLWQKYNQNINNQLDETNTNPFGFGDKLVIQAKEMLKPYKSYSFVAY